MKNISLKIGCVKYNVRFVSGKELENTNGDISRIDNEIRIHKDLPSDQKQIVLWHEILHAINDKLSEETVEFLAMAIVQVITDNLKNSIICRNEKH